VVRLGVLAVMMAAAVGDRGEKQEKQDAGVRAHGVLSSLEDCTPRWTVRIGMSICAEIAQFSAARMSAHPISATRRRRALDFLHVETGLADGSGKINFTDVRLDEPLRRQSTYSISNSTRRSEDSAQGVSERIQ
jgi:hypothetical protein